VPAAAAVEADSVIVVPHVAVQLAEENDAVTPDGRERAANDTETALPVTRVALTPSVVEFPWTTETLGDAADREILDDTTEPAVVNVLSEESVAPPDELVDPTRK
jgi:hypothetical protein